MNTKVANSDTFTLTLPSDTEFQITREFNAPRSLVYDAWSKPEHVKRWWNPGGELMVCDIDFRVGGAWRFVMESPHGDIGFNGIYQEISRPERIVNTLIFEPMPGTPGIVTLTMEGVNGRTRVTELSKLPSKEERDGVIASGMESGARISLDQLEVLVNELQSVEA
jgi:uncharacterized protein YndB with AHSA1/START domain